MLELTLEMRRTELREARDAVRRALGVDLIDKDHVGDVVVVVDELIAAARECEVTNPLQLTVQTYPQLTSVRLRCDRNVELRDKPFDIRELVIQRLVIAFGRRRRDDGSVDLWAEIPRRK
ncbi:MAG TPA: hypothetical protein VGP92_05590 [Acidimicrobiia bacterium]|nr:hypothetical protein [Acidimicrobiia bacterium]